MTDDLGKRALALLVKHEACALHGYDGAATCPECGSESGDYAANRFRHKPGCEWLTVIEAAGLPRKPLW